MRLPSNAVKNKDPCRHEWSAEAVRPRVGLYTRGRFSGCVLEHVPFERDPSPLDNFVTSSSPIGRTRPSWSGIPAQLLWLWTVRHAATCHSNNSCLRFWK